MLGSPCLRKIYYSSASVDEDYPFDISGKKRMKLGDAVHEMLHSVFKEAGITIEYHNPDGSINKDWKDKSKDDVEFPLECEELFIRKGKIDEVVILDGELWLGEYKSINSKGFQTLSQAKSEHIIQAVVYWFVFNKLLSEGKFSHIEKLKGFTKAKGVKWLYVNKDDTELKEFSMTEGDLVFSQIVEKIMTIKEHYDKKVLPPKTQDYCYSCNWRDKCKKNFNIE
jgi:CRISPR/Cas system-associated exonuclease Cas4 (RecB family)